ncbi:MAG: hypothetical protein ACXVCY_14435 [Pseudobdellovibrionaceae bacterium]
MNNLLVGLWLFTNILYKGQVSPRPNPNLQMTLNFETSGTNTLNYYRTGEDGFCRRQASYEYDGINLVQHITSLDENNAYFCQGDPDMTLGKTSTNKAYLKEGKLYLELEMGDEVLTYIWTPVPAAQK